MGSPLNQMYLSCTVPPRLRMCYDVNNEWRLYFYWALWEECCRERQLRHTYKQLLNCHAKYVPLKTKETTQHALGKGPFQKECM